MEEVIDDNTVVTIAYKSTDLPMIEEAVGHEVMTTVSEIEGRVNVLLTYREIDKIIDFCLSEISDFVNKRKAIEEVTGDQ